MLFKSVVALVALSFAPITSAQLATGYPIGPVTSSDTKWGVKVCDVTKYGAVADMSTDLGPPLLAAFNACKTGGIGKYRFNPWYQVQPDIIIKSISPWGTLRWRPGLI